MDPVKDVYDRPGPAIGHEQPVVIGIITGVQDAGKAAQLRFGVITGADARSPEQRGRGSTPPKCRLSQT